MRRAVWVAVCLGCWGCAGSGSNNASSSTAASASSASTGSAGTGSGSGTASTGGSSGTSTGGTVGGTTGRTGSSGSGSGTGSGSSGAGSVGGGGYQLAFAEGSSISLYSVDSQGSAQAVSNFAVSGEAYSVRWSPVSDQIALVTTAYTGNSVVDVYTTSGVALAQFQAYDFGWSPDGTQLLLSDYTSHLVLGPATGGSVSAPIEADPAQSPRWAPAGDARISFIDQASNGYSWDPQLIVSPAPGASSARLTVADQAFSYAWSPDGTQIAFQTMLPSQYYYLYCDVGVAQLTSVGVTATQPVVHGTDCLAGLAWSPDSRSLGLAQGNLFVVPANAPSSTDLGALSGLLPGGYYHDIYNLAWTPDGQYLAFTQPSASSYYYTASSDFLLEPVGGGSPLSVLRGLGGSSFDLR